MVNPDQARPAARSIRCAHAQVARGRTELILCDADLAAQGYSRTHRTHDGDRYIVTPWWCVNRCSLASHGTGVHRS